MEPSTINPGSPAPQMTPAETTKHKKPKIFWIGGIIIGLIALYLLLVGVARMFGGGSSANNELFFSVLTEASQKTKVQQHTAYQLWREGDPTSSKPQTNEVSLSEFDATTKQFNTVNASDDDAERCVNNKPHRYYVSGDGLSAAIATLNNPNAEEGTYADPNGPYSPCNINRSERTGKFSDGLIPVGLTKEQAAGWTGYFKSRSVFTVKDEGTTDYKGKTVRKLTLNTNPKFDTSALFFAVRDGDTGKADGLGVNWRTAFGMQISQGLVTPTGLSGFYLIDETTKLPVYSEFNSTVPEGKNAAQLPSFKQKVEYKYPNALSITEQTKLTNL